MEPTCY